MRKGLVIRVLGSVVAVALGFGVLAANGPRGKGAAVSVDWSRPTAISNLELGVTFIHSGIPNPGYSNPAAAASATAVLQRTSRFANTFIVGFGAGNVEPSPGAYNWDRLDVRIAYIRNVGLEPIITLAGAPPWMIAAGTSRPDAFLMAPLPEHYKDFADLAQTIARRYPDVKYFDVWVEMHGFWSKSQRRYDYEGYTQMYNAVYDALKSVSPDIKVGGPYAPISHARALTPQASSLRGPYGAVDQRPLDVITYWLANKHGADFISVDGRAMARDARGQTGPLFDAAQIYADVNRWIQARTNLPIWWAEWYALVHQGSQGPPAQAYALVADSALDHQHQNAVMAATLMRMAESGAAVALRWAPEGRDELGAYEGNQESLWSDTRKPEGGRPFPFAVTSERFRRCFTPGETLFRTKSTAETVLALASKGCVLLVNQAAAPVPVQLDGSTVALPPYGVAFLSESQHQGDIRVRPSR